MRIREAITHLKSNPKDAYYYWQGILRYWLYGRQWTRWLLRQHIIDQYELRRDWLARSCYLAGECCCGCQTPQVFFANKACSGGKPEFPRCANRKPCYNRFLDAKTFYADQKMNHKDSIHGTVYAKPNQSG